MEQGDDFNADPFFNDASLQQIDAAGIDALNAAVPIASSPQVVERILNLQASGCLTRVAWSRTGHIARIAEDGVSVDLYSLTFHPQSCSWGLGLKHTQSIGLGELSSLAWSPAGSDLAIIDSRGRLSILRPQNIALDRFSQVRSGVVDETDDFGQAIGLYWLGQDRPGQPKTAVQFASKSDTRWIHHPARALPHGPLSKRAVVIVDRKARLSLVFEKAEGTANLARLSTRLSSDSEQIFTHAAFSSTVEGKLLVALQSYSGILSTYFVRIEFPQSPEALGSLAVEASATHLTSTSSSGVLSGQLYNPESHSLTHLGILPSSEIQGPSPSPPTVFGVYSNINKSLEVIEPGFLVGSVICRWTISSTGLSLHPRFNELPNKSKDSSPSFTTSSQRLPDKHDQIITSISVTDNGQQSLCITTQDGRSDFLSSEDLSSLSYQGSAGEASSLAQSGFSLPLLTYPSFVTLSPNSCVAVLINDSEKLELATMEYTLGDGDPTSPASDAIVASVILSLARAIWGTASIEDILALVLHTFPPTFVAPLVTHLYRTLFKESEFISTRNPGNDLEKVVQKPVLTKVFAFHYMASFLSLKNNPISPDSKHISKRLPHTRQLCLSGQWAWVVANLRFVAYLLHSLNREVVNPKAVLTQDLVDVICGNIKWTLDLIRYIVAKILEIEDREMNPHFFPAPAPGEVKVDDGSQGLVPLLLNCHWSRQFFIAIMRVMRVLVKLPEPRTRHQIQILSAIGEGTSGKGVPLGAIEHLLAAAWSEPGDVGEPNEQAARQVEMMATGVVTGGYQGTVKRLLQRAFGIDGGLRKNGLNKQMAVDRLKVWEDEIDESWLMLEESGPAARRFDVHKKKIIKTGVREGDAGPLMIKKCVRCGRYSEDVNGLGTSGSVSKYVNILMIRCVCDGSWVIDPWDR